MPALQYFMNKIIQKQEIVPPWIERQQELVASANRFRARLRADWRRHAARVISSAGGSLESRIERAEKFAVAEAQHNPRPRRQEENVNTVDKTGHVSQISLAGELRPPIDISPHERMTTEVTITVIPAEDLPANERGLEHMDPSESSPIVSVENIGTSTISVHIVSSHLLCATWQRNQKALSTWGYEMTSPPRILRA